MTSEPLGPHGRPRRVPATSREINLAIDLLREVGADVAAIRLLDIWNAHRLVEAAQTVTSTEELQSLFSGLDRTPRKFPAAVQPARPPTVDEGAWS